LKIINVDDYRNMDTGIFEFGSLLRDIMIYGRIEESQDCYYDISIETVHLGTYPIYTRS